MLTDIEPTDIDKQKDFFRAVATAKAALEEFDPELILAFGPDHYNGFFYDLMPSFCIGVNAESRKDWHLEAGRLDIPQNLAVECIRSLHAEDFDVAVSYDMWVDHGITIPLFQLVGSLDKYPVLPVVINCPADPRPSFRRVRALGDAVGRFLAQQSLRVAVFGSGGLSHDPPTPRLSDSPPEVQERLIHRHTPTYEELSRRQDRVMRCARELVNGVGPCLPPSEEWDNRFLDNIIAFDTDKLDALTDEEVDSVAGGGGHEVRCWVAAVAAARAMGMRDVRLECYQLIPEWITGMGVIRGWD